MGCAASTSPAAPQTQPKALAASCGSGRASAGVSDLRHHYTLEALGSRDVFGPFLKLRSYDPDTGSYQVSVLVVCSEEAWQRHQARAEASWWELHDGDNAADSGAGDGDGGEQKPGPTVPAGAQAAAGELLYSWRHWRFALFRIVTVCGKAAKKLRYQVGLLPGRSYTIAVPSLHDSWHLAFYSCNGLHHVGDFDCAMDRLYSLWKDLARRHDEQPFHLLVGGGDQLYNDGVFEGPLLKGWDKAEDNKDTAEKVAIRFSNEMRAEVEEFYFSHYTAHWSRPAYAGLMASIPVFNTWDDHDIVDGWGSYDDAINTSAIMQGLFAASKLFYLLFQHHTTADRLAADGYFCEPSSSALLRLGPSTALLVPDTRTCRTQQRVLPPDFMEQMEARLRALPAAVRHVVLLAGVPMVYPRLPVQEALQKLNDLFTGDTLMSVIMQKTGLAARVTKRFGMVSILDDIIDQWSSTQHSEERDRMLELLMTLAAEKRFRVTLLSGDVHCAGYGMLHSRGDVREGDVEDMELPGADALAADPRFIPQIISSAIVNVPPPVALLRVLCLAGRCPAPILQGCVQRMVPLFGPKDDTHSLLMGRRNWCEVTLGDANDHLTFQWRCEKELGSEEVNTFSVTVPPLMDSNEGSPSRCLPPLSLRDQADRR